MFNPSKTVKREKEKRERGEAMTRALEANTPARGIAFDRRLALLVFIVIS